MKKDCWTWNPLQRLWYFCVQLLGSTDMLIDKLTIDETFYGNVVLLDSKNQNLEHTQFPN